MVDVKVSKKGSGYFEPSHVGLGKNVKEAVLQFTKLISGKELVYRDGKSGKNRFDVPVLDY